MKRNSLSLRIVLSVVLLLCASSCDASAVKEDKSVLTVASYNVQNLFDAVDDGSEYSEYTQKGGWTQKDYEKRLANTRKVLSQIPRSKDYIVVLNEIENSNVVNDLLFSEDMAKMGIRYYACTNEEDSAIQIAVISSVPIISANVHQVEKPLRPILEVGFDVNGNKVFVLAVHFKSNIGGESQTAVQRRKSAVVINEIAASIQKANPGCIILVCGDMNEEFWDDNAIGRSANCPIVVGPTFGRGMYYCFWSNDNLGLSSFGSYMYNGDWKCYDNILISLAGQDGYGLEYENAGVLRSSFVLTADNKPFSWDRRLLSGVSDHLPVWVTFRYE